MQSDGLTPPRKSQSLPPPDSTRLSIHLRRSCSEPRAFAPDPQAFESRRDSFEPQGPLRSAWRTVRPRRARKSRQVAASRPQPQSRNNSIRYRRWHVKSTPDMTQHPDIDSQKFPLFGPRSPRTSWLTWNDMEDRKRSSLLKSNLFPARSTPPWRPAWYRTGKPFPLKVFRGTSTHLVKVEADWDDEMLLKELCATYDKMRTFWRKYFSLRSVRYAHLY